jgi:hypothetical protein
MSLLSALIAPAERRSVGVTAGRLLAELAALAWPGHHQPSPELCRRVCFVVTAIAPELPLDRLSVLARYALWSILLDDRLDAPGAGPVTLHRIQHTVVATTSGRRTDLSDPTATVLAGILDELSSYDRSGATVVRFGAALRDAVDAGVHHAHLARAVAAGTAPPPTAEQYLEVAARSVNYRSFGYALLAAGPAGLTAAALDRLAPALAHAEHAVRLANDLRSVARDRAGATLNVLGLRTAGGAPVTPRLGADEIGRRRLAHRDELSQLIDPDLAQAARALARSLRVSVGLYQLTDLR